MVGIDNERKKKILQFLTTTQSKKQTLEKFYKNPAEFQPLNRLIKRCLREKVLEEIDGKFFLTAKAVKEHSYVHLMATPERQIEVQNMGYKLGIVEKPKNWLDWVERIFVDFRSTNGEASFKRSGFGSSVLDVSDFGHSVRFTEHFVIIRLRTQAFASIEKSVLELESEARAMIPKIEGVYGCRLSRDGLVEMTVNSRHIAFVEHPLARMVNDAGIAIEVYDEDGVKRIITDKSKGVNHLEGVRYNTNPEDMKRVAENNIKELLDGYSLKENHDKAVVALENIDEWGRKLNLITDSLLVLSREIETLAKVTEANSKLHGSLMSALMPKEKKEEVKEEVFDERPTYIN